MPRQQQACHGNNKHATATTSMPRQQQACHGNNNDAAATTTMPLQQQQPCQHGMAQQPTKMAQQQHNSNKSISDKKNNSNNYKNAHKNDNKKSNNDEILPPGKCNSWVPALAYVYLVCLNKRSRCWTRTRYQYQVPGQLCRAIKMGWAYEARQVPWYIGPTQHGTRYSPVHFRGVNTMATS